MIDLYGMGSPNVVKIYIALEELELPYTVHPIDVFGGQQFSADFVRRNPNAKVPLIVDHAGPGGQPYTVFESGAILLYLAEKTLRLLPTDMAARYEVIQWLMVQMTGLGPMSGQLIHFIRFAPGGNEYARSRYATQVHRLFQVIDARLAQVPYLGGATYSIADIATFPWLRLADVLIGTEKTKYPNVQRWVDTIAARPAVIRAMKAVDEVRARTTQFDKADPDVVDKVMGRGQYATA
jgi:GSH-dependent disulfide-bond oxidoreductase